MIVTEVTKDDCRLAAQLINTLHVGDYAVGGKDICAAADAIRWLQDLAKKMAESYASPQPAAAPAAPVGDAPFTVKAMSPGRAAKKGK